MLRWFNKWKMSIINYLLNKKKKHLSKSFKYIEYLWLTPQTLHKNGR